MTKCSESSMKKRILSLDGGGIRGVISLEILQRIEDIIREQRGKKDLVLAEYFDLIAGTSTGAIIATGLALGMSVKELSSFYHSAGPAMFAHDKIWHLCQNKYTDKVLRNELIEVFGEDTLLGSEKFKTLLMVVLQNATKDEAWIISNDPNCEFNKRTRTDSQLNLPVWKIVRASTAAPTFFPPEEVQIGERSFVFVDGSVSSFTNPAFQAFMKATCPPYNLNWNVGQDDLLVVSVGTGLGPHHRKKLDLKDFNLLASAKLVPASLILSTVVEQDVLCRTFGKCIFGNRIDDEIEKLEKSLPPGGKNLFSYVRYNEELSDEGLTRLGLPKIKPENVVLLDSTDHINELVEIGAAIAAQQVTSQHFKDF